MQSAGSAQSGPVKEMPVSRQRSPFMPVKEAARAFDVSEMTVRRAVAAGKIPGIRWGRTFRVLRAFVVNVITAAEAGQQVDIEEFAATWPHGPAADVSEVVA